MLTQLAAETHPDVVLPPAGGSPAGLSMMVALVGKSGKGKGTTWDLGEDLLCRWPRFSPELHLQSGEGLAQALGENRAPTDAELAAAGPGADTGVRFRRKWSNLVSWTDELSTLAAAAGRNGSSLIPTLRTVVTGGKFGSSLADASRSRSVLRGTYRVGIGFGVPPRGGDVLYGPDAHDGTVQRLLTVRCGLYPGTWRPAELPSTAIEIKPLLPPPPAWALPYFGALTVEQMEDRTWRPGTWLELPGHVRAWVEAEADRQALADDDDQDDDDGHAVLTRLKVAALLDLLHQRDPLTAQAWEWSAVVMRASRDGAAWFRQLAENAAQRDEQRKGAGAAHRKHGEALEGHRIATRVRRLIVKTITDHLMIGDHGPRVAAGAGCTMRCFERATTSEAQRSEIKDTVDSLLSKDPDPPVLVKLSPVKSSTGGRPSPRYGLAPGFDPKDL